MTKTDVFAGWAGWNHIPNLDIAVFDNHSVDEQFHQFPFLLKVGIFQTGLDAAAKVFDGNRQAGQLILPVDLLEKLLSQVFGNVP